MPSLLAQRTIPLRLLRASWVVKKLCFLKYSLLSTSLEKTYNIEKSYDWNSTELLSVYLMKNRSIKSITPHSMCCEHSSLWWNECCCSTIIVVPGSGSCNMVFFCRLVVEQAIERHTQKRAEPRSRADATSSQHHTKKKIIQKREERSFCLKNSHPFMWSEDAGGKTVMLCVYNERKFT